MQCVKKYSRWFAFVSVAAAFVCVIPAQAATVHYEEASSGDLVDALFVFPGISPGTVVGTFDVGGNNVNGTFGNAAGDTDVFTFEISAGHQLDAIFLEYTVISGNPGNGSYFAINDGTDIGTVSPEPANNLSDALINTSGDILDDLAAGPAFQGVGLTAPLPAGTYTMFLSELGAQVGYTLSFEVSAVPEPASAAMMSFALLMGSAWVRRVRPSPFE